MIPHLLPQTPEQYDVLVDRVAFAVPYSTKDYLSQLVSNAIRNFPKDKSHITFHYLLKIVQKQIANDVAYEKFQALQNAAKVKFIMSRLQQEPNDTEARDALVKFAAHGSIEAKDALAILNIDINGVPITPAPVVSET